jgi:hypothetical protein
MRRTRRSRDIGGRWSRIGRALRAPAISSDGFAALDARSGDHASESALEVSGMWERLFPGMTGRQVLQRAVVTTLLAAIAVGVAIALAMTLVQTGSDA